MTQPAQSSCKMCGGRGWVSKRGLLLECPRCVGQVPVAELSPEQRKT